MTIGRIDQHGLGNGIFWLVSSEGTFLDKDKEGGFVGKIKARTVDAILILSGKLGGIFVPAATIYLG